MIICSVFVRREARLWQLTDILKNCMYDKHRLIWRCNGSIVPREAQLSIVEFHIIPKMHFRWHGMLALASIANFFLNSVRFSRGNDFKTFFMNWNLCHMPKTFRRSPIIFFLELNERKAKMRHVNILSNWNAQPLYHCTILWFCSIGIKKKPTREYNALTIFHSIYGFQHPWQEHRSWTHEMQENMLSIHLNSIRKSRQKQAKDINSLC